MIEHLAVARQLPWHMMVGGDFNLQAFDLASWLVAHQQPMAVAHTSEPTCTTKTTASLIDYFMVPCFLKTSCSVSVYEPRRHSLATHTQSYGVHFAAVVPSGRKLASHVGRFGAWAERQ